MLERGGNDTLVLGAGVLASNVLFQVVGNDLYVRFRNSVAAIKVKSVLSIPASPLATLFPYATLFRSLTQPLTFTWIGNGVNDTLTGSGYGNNVFSETVAGTHWF